ncbi:MAG: hypothetical protein QM757_05775 [Paludibaculum sp.]
MSQESAELHRPAAGVAALRVLPEVPEANGEIEVIAQEITRLDRVVRTFLDFTRPELEMRTRECDLGGLATRNQVELRPATAELSRHPRGDHSA